MIRGIPLPDDPPVDLWWRCAACSAFLGSVVGHECGLPTGRGRTFRCVCGAVVAGVGGGSAGYGRALGHRRVCPAMRAKLKTVGG